MAILPFPEELLELLEELLADELLDEELLDEELEDELELLLEELVVELLPPEQTSPFITGVSATPPGLEP